MDDQQGFVPPPPGAPRFDPPTPQYAPPSSAIAPPPPGSPAEGLLAGPRPRPRVPAVLAAAGGLLVISSLAIFISELPHKNRRISGLLLSVGFEAVGVLALLLWRRRPAVAVGVVVSALAVVAVVIFAFVDPNRPNVAFGSLGRSKGTLTGILAVSAGAWLVGYIAGPGRRAAFYLGAALIAVWLLLLVQIVASALDRSSQSTSFTPGGTGLGPDLNNGSSLSRFSSTASSALTRTGLVSLVVGLLYLAAGYLLDRRESSRAATPFFVTTAVTLTVAVLALISPWQTEGAAILAMVLGSLFIWFGAMGARRFTAWYGGFALFAGTLALLAKLSHHNNKVAGGLALAAGIGLALLANWLTDRAEPPREAPELMTPLGPWTPPASSVPAAAGSGAPASWQAPQPPVDHWNPPAPPPGRGDPPAPPAPPGYGR